MGFRTRLRLSQAIAAVIALAVTAMALWAAAAYHPGEVGMLLGYGVPVALMWALAGMLLYLPRRVRESARLARARGLSDPRTTAFLAWAEREHLTDQDCDPKA